MVKINELKDSRTNELTNYNVRAEKGFTLMEILAVVTILGILITTFTVFGPKIMCQIRSGTASSQLKQLSGAVRNYQLMNEDKLPDSIDQLETDMKTTDPWGQKIQIEVVDQESGTFKLKSNGCDKKSGTADDKIYDSTSNK